MISILTPHKQNEHVSRDIKVAHRFWDTFFRGYFTLEESDLMADPIDGVAMPAPFFLAKEIHDIQDQESSIRYT